MSGPHRYRVCHGQPRQCTGRKMLTLYAMLRLPWVSRASVGRPTVAAERDMDVFFGRERRKHLRLCSPFPVLVRGVKAGGQPFTFATVLDNFGAGGLYVRLAQRLLPGTWLFAVVHMATRPSSET